MKYRNKKTQNTKEEVFVYQPKFTNRKKIKQSKKPNKNSPFEKLAELRFR